MCVCLYVVQHLSITPHHPSNFCRRSPSAAPAVLGAALLNRHYPWDRLISPRLNLSLHLTAASQCKLQVILKRFPPLYAETTYDQPYITSCNVARRRPHHATFLSLHYHSLQLDSRIHYTVYTQLKKLSLCQIYRENGLCLSKQNMKTK